MSARVHARTDHEGGRAAARRLRTRARAYLAALDLDDVELSILVVGDRAMRRLNARWRGIDRTTDVLSFPHVGPAGAALLGDVVVSLDTARRAARAERSTLGAELDRYLAHGILHLLGHDHHRPAEARRMAEAEERLVGDGMVARALGPEARPTPRAARGRGRAR